MKRVISSNNIPLILNGKYAWRIINDPQCGEIYKIDLGNSYIDIHEECYELIYYSKYSKLLLYIGLSDEEWYGKETSKIKMIMDFKDTEFIIDSLFKANPKMRLLPLYDAGYYE